MVTNQCSTCCSILCNTGGTIVCTKCAGDETENLSPPSDVEKPLGAPTARIPGGHQFAPHVLASNCNRAREDHRETARTVQRIKSAWGACYITCRYRVNPVGRPQDSRPIELPRLELLAAAGGGLWRQSA